METRRIALACAALAGAVLLAGCGKVGPNYVPNVYDANGKPVKTTHQPPPKERHFILDPLIK